MERQGTGMVAKGGVNAADGLDGNILHLLYREE